MVKSGRNLQNHVFALMDIHGTDNSVIKPSTVPETEFGIKQLNNVSVPLPNIGTEDNVQSDLPVVEEEFGTPKPLNAIVELDGSGIQQHVLDVQVVKFGISPPYNAYVLEEQSGMEQTVELFSNAEMDKSGIPTFGNVNALIILRIMEFTVSQILVRMEEFGVININLVFALTTKSGIQELVFLQESTALMVEFGTQQFMLVVVHLEHSPTSTSVILFQHVTMVKDIIP